MFYVCSRRPFQRNIKPMTRLERAALKDKVALEKSRLRNRAGNAARMYRENLPPEGVSLTEMTPEAAGFLSGKVIGAAYSMFWECLHNERIQFRSLCFLSQMLTASTPTL